MRRPCREISWFSYNLNGFSLYIIQCLWFKISISESSSFSRKWWSNDFIWEWNNLSDSSKEYCVLKSEHYLIAKWYSFSNEGRKVATYNKSSDLLENRLIHNGEVFSTNIEIIEKIDSKTKQYQMDITDYRTLLCSVNWEFSNSNQVITIAKNTIRCHTPYIL